MLCRKFQGETGFLCLPLPFRKALSVKRQAPLRRSLEEKPQTEPVSTAAASIAQAGVVVRADGSAGEGVFRNRIRHAKVPVVEQVECLCTELQLESLADLRRLEDRHVHLVEGQSEERIAPDITKWRLEKIERIL